MLKKDIKKVAKGCKKLYMKEFIRCRYNLQDTEFYVLFLLLKEDYLSTNEISQMISRDRTTVQKILKKFENLGLLKKFQENLERGYRYIYKILNKEEILDEIETELNSYINQLRKELKDLKEE